MPEFLESTGPELELGNENVEKFIGEMISSDIQSIVDSFLPENPLGGELNIELEVGSNLGMISKDQLVIIMNAKLVENGIPSRVVSFSTEESTLFVLLEVASQEEKEQSVETIHRTFSNTCAFCKATISVESDVPVNAHGKVKKGKDGRQYRDWDYGLHDCTCTSEDGATRKVFLFFREYLEHE